VDRLFEAVGTFSEDDVPADDQTVTVVIRRSVVDA
jgi:hypothetical protein